MKVSQYVSDGSVEEISTPVKVDVLSTRPTLDLCDVFLTELSYKSHFIVVDVDEYDASVTALREIVEDVLDGMTVETLINTDDEEYREFEGWEYALELEKALHKNIRLFPDWQLKFAATRLQKLAFYVETKKL